MLPFVPAVVKQCDNSYLIGEKHTICNNTEMFNNEFTHPIVDEWLMSIDQVDWHGLQLPANYVI